MSIAKARDKEAFSSGKGMCCLTREDTLRIVR
ncbi:MAG: hypothetical protein ACJA16_003876 [Akkermansiaceae bacterium]|jgi:hypothetical protein